MLCRFKTQQTYLSYNLLLDDSEEKSFILD